MGTWATQIALGRQIYLKFFIHGLMKCEVLRDPQMEGAIEMQIIIKSLHVITFYSY